MQYLRLILFCICFFVVSERVIAQSILTEIPLSQCIRYNSNGSQVATEYDVCTSFCCGGQVVDNSTKADCCGSIEFGSPYQPQYEQCCHWWTGHGMGHVRRYPGERIQCCGAHRINWGLQSCCYGHPDPPEVFMSLNQICCNANALPLPFGVPRHFTSCCGKTQTYDRRFSSCPCDDGGVLMVTQSKSGCCITPEGLRTPYVMATQICCPNGQVGEIGTNFCCGQEQMGTIGTDVCCSGTLFPVEPRNITKTACCNETAYNPEESLCCNEMVMSIVDGADQCCSGIPYNRGKSVCCETRLWSTETQGTECCGSASFFPGKGSFCCNGDIFLSMDAGGNACCGSGEDVIFYFIDQMEFLCCDGVLGFRSTSDSCCGNSSYDSKQSICCEGQVYSQSSGDSCCNGTAYFKSSRSICCGNGPYQNARTPRCCGGDGYDVEGGQVCCGNRVFGRYKWPACCVDEGYDAFTHVCCGAIIYPNPSGGNQGACCGNIAYDRGSQLCCSGLNVTIPSDIPLSRAECCNFEIYNTDTQLCCNDIIRPKLNPYTTKCCGLRSYNASEQICCIPPNGEEPVLNEFEFGEETTACCGGVLYNTTASYCCDGLISNVVFEETGCCAGVAFNMEESVCCNNVLRQIGNVPRQRANCCGDKCIFEGVQRCCNLRVYQMNMQTNNTCEDF